MDPLQEQASFTPIPSQEDQTDTTTFDETMPVGNIFKNFHKNHHRLILFASIIKRRYFIAFIAAGIFLCLLGEVLLMKEFLALKNKEQAQVTTMQQSQKILPPKNGMYLSAFPDFGDSEDVVSLAKMQEYETLAGKKMYWVYFSNNWYNGISFPKEEVKTIYQNGNIPYIRLMPRSMLYETSTEPILTLARIAKGDFDVFLKQWAKDAKAYGHPLMVEFGPEVNGDWQPWNATYSGGQKDGPTRFINAYRHIIDLFRSQGVQNITWVYHVTIPSSPDKPWNSYTSYYPGDAYIDWIGLSVYGALTTQDTWQSFTEKMNKAYPQLVKDFPNKPIAIAELGVVDSPDKGDKAKWLTDALESLRHNTYPQVKAVSVWHATWQQADGTQANTRIDSSPEVLAAFKKEAVNPFFIGGSGTIAAVSSYIPLSGQLNPQNSTDKTDQPLVSPGATIATAQSSSANQLIGRSWQWQLVGPIDTSVPAAMFDVDYEKTDAETVADIHAKGAKVICYINVGQWEPSRQDSSLFPQSVLGNDVNGSQGEKWLDVSNINALSSIIEHRFDICKQKGFDGIDPDSVDNYARDTGFSLTEDDQITYNRWLSSLAHQKGLSIGLHNDNDQVHDLLGYFDFAITDACINQGRCDDFSQFITFGKPVFDAEYTDNGTTTGICDEAKTLQFNVIIKNSQLDSFRQSCQ